MTYRGDEEALRARIGQLEGELEDARGTIAKLRGEGAASGASGGELVHSRLLGVPVGIVLEHELSHAITEAGFERIAQVLRERLRIQVAQVGKTLHAPGVFSLSTENGRTRLRLSLQLPSALAAGSITGLSLFPALGALGVLHDTGANPLHALWALPAIVAGAAVFAHRVGRKNATTGIDQARGTFAAILEIAEAHAVRPPRVRVEEAGEADELEESEAGTERAPTA